MSNAPYDIVIVDGLSTIEQDEWQSCTTDHPFISYAFLRALEVSLSVGPEHTGWIPRHITLRDEGGILIGAMPNYLKLHSQGEYIFDHSWAEAYMHAGGHYYPKSQCSIPFTPATGPRLLIHQDKNPSEQKDIEQALLSAAKEFTDKNYLSSFHATFLTKDQSESAADCGLLIRNDQQFHWYNQGFNHFDDFLDSLSSRKRKQIRKERRTAAQADVNINQLSGRDLTDWHWDIFFQCYQDTGARKWGTPYLTKEFFLQVGQTMPDQIMMVFVTSMSGDPIAAALNFVGKEAIYGRHWGALKHFDCLHFEACYYQAIDYAIKHGLKRVEAGAQGPHKIARGYQPTKTYSAHYLREAAFHDAVAQFLEAEKKHVDAEIDYLTDFLPFKKSL